MSAKLGGSLSKNLTCGDDQIETIFSNRDPAFSVKGLKYMEFVTGPDICDVGMSTYLVKWFITEEDFNKLAQYIDVDDNTSQQCSGSNP